MTLTVFSGFTCTKLENSNLENSDFSKTAQNCLKRNKLEEETYVQKFNNNNSNKLCSIGILHTI